MEKFGSMLKPRLKRYIIVMLGTLLAQMQLGLLVVKDLGEVHCGLVLLALFAIHSHSPSPKFKRSEAKFDVPCACLRSKHLAQADKSF